MAGFIKNYYATANTAKGFQNFFESNLKNLNKIYILKGGPGTGKSTLMKKVGEHMTKLDYDVEYLHCSSDNGSLDGVIIPYLSVAIVDGTSPHVIEPNAPGAIEEYVNLGVAWDCDKLANHKTEILDLKEKISSCYPKAYSKFAEALKIHDEWEKIYIENMDFHKANILTSKVIDILLKDISLNKESIVTHRFFGGSTPKGPVDFVPNITEKIAKRYFIKGRPGSGKSTMLKKILAKTIESGIDVEIYHCGFDPNSLDMLLMPELDVCIFDSTSPHEYYPSRAGDEVIDMYAELITPGTDEKYEKELNDIISRYKECNKIGISYLAKAKSLHDQLEKYYIDATNFNIIDNIYNNLIDKILKH